MEWTSSLILLGLAIIALLLFTFMWGRFSPPSANPGNYTPVVYLKTTDIPPISDIPPDISEDTPPASPEMLVQPTLPVQPAKIKRPIIKPVVPTRNTRNTRNIRKITGEIVPLYSKKRRSRGENMCAKSLEEIFGVPFPSERPIWAPGKKGRSLEYDCINHQLKLALEYHGQQHYEPGHFNMDDDGFADQNERDRMKIKHAQDNGYYLITVPYTVPIEEIKSYIIDYLPGNRKRRLDEDLTL